MNLKDIFKRKKKEAVIDENSLLPIMVEYIKEAKKLKHSEEIIMSKFKNKGYPNELILRAFKLNLEQEVKMAKKKKLEEEEIEDEDEEEFEEEEEDLDEEEEEVEDEEVEEKPKKKKVVKKKDKKEQAPTIQDVLMNFDQRISNLEASQYRIANAFR